MRGGKALVIGLCAFQPILSRLLYATESDSYVCLITVYAATDSVACGTNSVLLTNVVNPLWKGGELTDSNKL